jgi:hypothetical protein
MLTDTLSRHRRQLTRIVLAVWFAVGFALGCGCGL